MTNRLILFGCGGHAKSIADVYLSLYPENEIVFVDEAAKPDEKILGFDVVINYNISDEHVFVSSGDAKFRYEIIREYYGNAINIISPNAYVGRDVKLKKGIFIAHGAHVGIGSSIGDGVIINTNASIDHEVSIGGYTHIAPNVTICGKVKIGSNCMVGAGSVVIQDVVITDGVVIGAGSVIVKNFLEPGKLISNVRMSYRSIRPF